jgi:cytoskeletal protein CcmA (bactofilin family)
VFCKARHVAEDRQYVFCREAKCLICQKLNRRYGSCVEGPAVLPTTTTRELKLLQKDGFFRRREEGQFRQTQTNTPAPAPAANAAPAPSEATTRSTSSDVRSDERKEAKLVVGPQIKIKGVEISDCDTLVVEGRIEATLDSRVLEITEHGVFQGTIAVDNAEVHGRFEGELTVRKQLIIHATGKVSGKIRYAKIKVEEGAELAGEISVLEKAQSTVAVTRRANAA